MNRKNSRRSINRMRTLGEVFTAEREVKAMLDLVEEKGSKKISDRDSRVFEPACGNGNFLEEILRRKTQNVLTSKGKGSQTLYEYNTLCALSSIYGIDIDPVNIQQAHARMFAVMLSAYSSTANTERPHEGYLDAVRYVLNTNIVVGDTVNAADKIVLIKYVPVDETKSFVREIKTLNDALYEDEDFSRATFPPVYYLDMATDGVDLKDFVSSGKHKDLFTYDK